MASPFALSWCTMASDWSRCAANIAANGSLLNPGEFLSAIQKIHSGKIPVPMAKELSFPKNAYIYALR